MTDVDRRDDSAAPERGRAAPQLQQPRLGDVLVRVGLLSAGQLDDVLSSQMSVGDRRERLGETAVRLGYCTADEVARALAHQLHLEFLDTTALPIADGVVAEIPSALARTHQMIPLWREEHEVVVACADPTDVVALEEVRTAVGARRVRPVVASAQAVEAAIRRAYEFDHRAGGLVDAIQTRSYVADDADSDAAAHDRSVMRLADELVANALRSGATEVHVEPRPAEYQVRQRVDGLLVHVMTVGRAVGGPLVSRFKLVAGLDAGERQRPQDGHGRFHGRDGRPGAAGDDGVDLRITTIPARFGESLVIAVHDREAEQHTLDRLGLDPRQQARLVGALEQPHGLVLFAGAAGAGTTATLYAALAHLVSGDRKIVTVEDRPAADLPGAVQTHVDERSGYTFARAVQSVLRQRPDVLALGALPDADTVRLALDAALDRRVLATVRAPDTVAAVQQLQDVGAAPQRIAQAVTLVLAQRLLRTVCSDCALPEPPDSPARQALRLAPNGPAAATRFVQGAGCDRCGGSGYRGRTAIFELQPMGTPLRRAVARGVARDELLAAGRVCGLRTLREHAVAVAAAGVTTLEEVARVTPTAPAATGACPLCTRAVQPDFAVCPWCACTLRSGACTDCGRALAPDWQVCPSCGTAAGAPTSPTTARVLVVDASMADRKTVEATLSDHYEVLHAGSAAEGLERAHRERPSAVVVSLDMPGPDGLAFVREVRARPALRDVPVVVVAATPGPDTELEALRSGAAACLLGPPQAGGLLGCLRSLVDPAGGR